jgi:hypothetical protein
MKRVYIKPETEQVVSNVTSAILKASYIDHADARQNDEFFDEVNNDEDIKSRNLWDE